MTLRFSFEVQMSPEYKDRLALVFCNQRFCLLSKLASLTENVIDALLSLAFGDQGAANSLQSHNADEPVSHAQKSL